MELREIEAFVLVLESGGFSKAAELLGLSQPTVSARVSALERALKVRLLSRTTKELHPTEAGRLFYRRAKQMLELRDQASREMAPFSSAVRGIVTVAASTVPAASLLPGLLRSFREKYPEIVFELQTTDSQEAVERVEAHQVEIGFCGTQIRSSKCVFRELMSDNLVVVTPDTPEYRRYLPGGFPVRRLERESLICRERGSGTRRETELFLREMGVDPERLRVVLEVRSGEQIQRLVRAGKGVAVLSRSALGQQPEGLLTFNFNSARLRRKLYILRSRSGALTPAGRTFFAFAQEYCRSRRAEGSPT